MIILNTTTRKLQLKLSGAVATNELPWTASYVDITTTAFTPAASNGVTTGATAVDIVGVPGASTQRQVKFLSIQNADTAAAEITVIYNDNGTLRTVCKCSLAVGDNLQYVDGQGFAVFNSSGQVKTTGGWTSHASFNNLDYATAGHTGFAPALGGDDNYVTDAEKTVLGNTSNTNTGDETAARIGTIVNAATNYTTPLDADKIGIWDAANSLFKAVTWANIKATLLATLNVWTKTQRGTVTSLTSAGASIAIDLGVTNNYSHTMTENTTLAAPSNAVIGQTGYIIFTQHASAAKTLAFNTAWKPSTGTAGVISTTVGATNVMSYAVESSGVVTYTWITKGIA